MNLKRERDAAIIQYIKELKHKGYKTKEAIKLAGIRFYLSETRVRDIVYRKESNA